MNTKLIGNLKRIVFFLIGNFLYALSINLFLIPHNIAAGGFIGFATVINYVTPIPIGTVVFLMNIPLLLIAFKVKGIAYTALTLLSSFIYSLFIDVTAFLPSITQNPLVAAIYGGVLYGAGAVAIMRANTSCGGTDLLARLLIVKYKSFSIGKMFMCVDGLSVIFSIIVQQNLETGLYSLLTIFICSKIADSIIQGFDYASLFFIITEQDPKVISDALIKVLARGVTNIKGTGMFYGTKRNILMVTVKKMETYKVKDILSSIDQKAFIIVAQANEVLGNGFKSNTEKLMEKTQLKRKKRAFIDFYRSK